MFDESIAERANYFQLSKLKLQSQQAADDILSYKPYITAHACYMWLGFGLLKLLSIVIPDVSMIHLESVTTLITAASVDV